MKTNIIQELFNFSQRAGHQVVWTTENRSFTETVLWESAEAHLHITRTVTTLHFAAKWYQLDNLTLQQRACILEYLLERNGDANRVVFYSVDSATQTVMLVANLPLAQDIEDNLGGYISVRHYVLHELEHLSERMDEAFKRCGEAT